MEFSHVENLSYCTTDKIQMVDFDIYDSDHAHNEAWYHFWTYTIDNLQMSTLKYASPVRWIDPIRCVQTRLNPDSSFAMNTAFTLRRNNPTVLLKLWNKVIRGGSTLHHLGSSRTFQMDKGNSILWACCWPTGFCFQCISWNLFEECTN